MDASSASSTAAAARLFRGGGSGVGAADAEGGTSALHAGAGTPAPAPAPALVSHDHCSKPSITTIWCSCALSSSQQRRHAGTMPAACDDAGEAAIEPASSRFCLTRRCEPPEFMSVYARGGAGALAWRNFKLMGDIQRPKIRFSGQAQVAELDRGHPHAPKIPGAFHQKQSKRPRKSLSVSVRPASRVSVCLSLSLSLRGLSPSFITRVAPHCPSLYLDLVSELGL